MTKRRIPFLLIVLAAIVGVVLVSRPQLAAERPIYSTAAVGWMPSAPPTQGLTETWFCPGVPATGVDEVGGSIVISNRSGERRVGTILGSNDINIATMQVGRKLVGGEAIMVLTVDKSVPKDVLAELSRLPDLENAKEIHV